MRYGALITAAGATGGRLERHANPPATATRATATAATVQAGIAASRLGRTTGAGGSVAWGSVAWGSVDWGSVDWGSVDWGSGPAGSVAAGSEAPFAGPGSIGSHGGPIARQTHRRDEAVALLGDRFDVGLRAAVVGQGLAEHGDVAGQPGLGDVGVGPDALHQRLLVDHLAGAFDQRRQGVERFGGQRHALAAPLEQKAVEPKLAEGINGGVAVSLFHANDGESGSDAVGPIVQRRPARAKWPAGPAGVSRSGRD
jgi:hypothetical protein